MSWSAFICELCAYILVWTFSMSLYGALHIVCQHIYVHSIVFLRVRRFCLRGSHQFNFQFTCLVSTRGPGAYCPQGFIAHSMCLQFFLFAEFRSIRYDSYVGLGPKLHTYILFPVYVHYIFMNATSYTRYYLFLVQVNQYFYSVPVIQFSLSVPVQQVQYFCQYRYFFDSFLVLLSSFILVELCSSPRTLHHSRL